MGIYESNHEVKKDGSLAALPPELAVHGDAVRSLIDSVFSDAQYPLKTAIESCAWQPLCTARSAYWVVSP